MDKNYEPYGKEWFVEMMKIGKSKIVEWFREECVRNRDPIATDSSNHTWTMTSILRISSTVLWMLMIMPVSVS